MTRESRATDGSVVGTLAVVVGASSSIAESNTALGGITLLRDVGLAGGSALHDGVLGVAALIGESVRADLAVTSAVASTSAADSTLGSRLPLTTSTLRAGGQHLGLGSTATTANVNLVGVGPARCWEVRTAEGSGTTARACARTLVARVITSVDSASSLSTGITLFGISTRTIAVVQRRWLDVLAVW